MKDLEQSNSETGSRTVVAKGWGRDEWGVVVQWM